MSKKDFNLANTLRELLQHESINTQEEILHALHKRGIDANQTKISRTLRQLGAVKTKNAAGEIIYQFPKDPAPPAPAHYSDLITTINHNEMVIILHTSPGSASLIARSLDHQQQALQIIGTVAGDDTILVIPQSIKKLSKVLHNIKLFLGLIAK